MEIKEPKPLTTSEIECLADEDLENIIEKLEDELSAVKRAGGDPQAWEIELCYLKRERDIRNAQD